MSVNMILVGAGFMGKTHLKASESLASARYIGIVDAHRPAAEALAKEYGVPAFDDVISAINVLKPDAADICAPTTRHLPIIIACAENRVNVLCEKPIALTKADANAVRMLAAKTGIRVMIAQVLRFWPEYAFAAAFARRGTFGKIKAVECRRLSSPPAWNSWMMRPDAGGGAVLDLQIHDMDFVLQLLGRPAAICSRGVLFNDAFNTVFNRLEYSSGVIAEVKASFLMPPSYPFRMAFSVEFEKGIIEMDSWREKGKRLGIYPARGKMYCPKLEQLDPYGAEIDYFARRLRAGKSFSRVPLDDSITALDMCLASKRSCATGQSVRLK